MWDMSLTPPVVAVTTCQALREALGLGDGVSDADCRLLADSNMTLFTEVAEAHFAAGRIQVKEFGIRVLEIGGADLQAVAGRFSKGVLSTSVIWGDR